MVNSLVVTKSHALANGLTELHIHGFQGKTRINGLIRARSGLPGKQNFRTLPNQVVGRYEPCPEGLFVLGPLQWAGKKGDYKTLWPAINSPFWVQIDGKRATGFHRDAGVPGTAGCIGLLPDEEKKFIDWWNGYGPFQVLYTNWGLGYVKIPHDLRV
jgi:hypothetical protein